VADGGAVVDRLDPKAFKGFGGAKAGDAAFFKSPEVDLTPRLTVESGGQTFHLSEPFAGPAGRVAVIAFQETGSGTVVPRTFYLSGEHGVWRAATGYGGGRIHKGPFKTPSPGKAFEFDFVNESAADLGADLQGVLSRWVGDRGVRSLPDTAVTRRAFFDHLDFNSEYAGYVGADDVKLTLPAGAQPNFATGPLERWSFQSPLYGAVEGFLYSSADGSALYVVLRNEAGQVWVPSIQASDAALTPFGTRARAYLHDLTTTPKVHNPLDEPPPGMEYIPNPGYRNPLNDLFASNLPAPGAPGTTTTAGTAAGASSGARATGPTPSTAGTARSPAGGAPHANPRDQVRLTGAGVVGTVAHGVLAGGSGPFTIMTQPHLMCWSRLYSPIATPWGVWLLPFDTFDPAFFRNVPAKDNTIVLVEPNNEKHAELAVAEPGP
jgi:hypothetical protein